MVEVVTGDVQALVSDLGAFDLVFVDAVAGEWTGLDRTLDALRPGGVLVVDDMDLARYADADHRAAVTTVRNTLLGDSRLVVAEIDAGTGIMVATRRRD